VVVVGFEDSEDAVAWQVQQVIRELAGGGVRGAEARAGLACDPLWRALTEFQLLPDAPLTFKANLLPSAVADFCLAADTLPERPLLQAHAGSGIVRGHAGGDLTLERAGAMLKVLLGKASAAQGNVILPRCPAGWKSTLPVWGLPRPDAWLMRQVKERLDPQGVFNPGRFVEGI
jgi:glycolate oxidase FAD binding subunit